MNPLRPLCAALLLALSACNGGEEPAPAARPDPAPPVSVGSDSTAVDGDAALPPGLEPVAEDPAGQSTADREVDGSGRAAPATRPAPPAPAGTTAPSPAPAQSPAQEDEAAQILRRAAAAYADIRSMQATFVMQFNNPLLRQETTSRGTLYQQHPDRFALRFSDPDGDVILSDGQHFYIYQPSIDANQATQTAASPGAGGGVDLQTQFVGNPTERFRYTLEGRESVGERPAHVMTLVPRERAEYRSLKVWFDTRDSLARRFEITEHNGSVRRFDLSGLQVNRTIPASVFRFTPPDNVRIVRVG